MVNETMSESSFLSIRERVGNIRQKFKPGDFVTIVDELPIDWEQAPMFTPSMRKTLGKTGRVRFVYSNGEVDVMFHQFGTWCYKQSWLRRAE